MESVIEFLESSCNEKSINELVRNRSEKSIRNYTNVISMKIQRSDDATVIAKLNAELNQLIIELLLKRSM